MESSLSEALEGGGKTATGRWDVLFCVLLPVLAVTSPPLPPHPQQHIFTLAVKFILAATAACRLQSFLIPRTSLTVVPQRLQLVNVPLLEVFSRSTSLPLSFYSTLFYEPLVFREVASSYHYYLHDTSVHCSSKYVQRVPVLEMFVTLSPECKLTTSLSTLSTSADFFFIDRLSQRRSRELIYIQVKFFISLQTGSKQPADQLLGVTQVNTSLSGSPS